MGKKTDDIPKNDRSKRFLEVINKIQELNKISDSQLSRELSGNENNKDLVNKIRKGVTEPQYENIEVFSTLYQVNKEFILGNSPEMFIKKEPALTRDELLLENRNLHIKLQDILESKNKDKDKIIELMEKINELNERLRKLG